MFLNIFGLFDGFFEDLKANCSAIDGRTKFLRGVPEINLFSTDGSGRWLYLLLEPGRAAASSSPFRAGAAHLALQPPDNTVYGHGYPHGEFLCCSPQSAALDCCCPCLKPALVLPHWDTTESEYSQRCLERGLPGNPGMQQRFFSRILHACAMCIS